MYQRKQSFCCSITQIIFCVPCKLVPVVLYECETWSVILIEACRPRVFGNIVLSKTHGVERDELIGEWRRPHNEELNGL
jgi:hypothetical protein